MEPCGARASKLCIFAPVLKQLIRKHKVIFAMGFNLCAAWVSPKSFLTHKVVSYSHGSYSHDKLRHFETEAWL